MGSLSAVQYGEVTDTRAAELQFCPWRAQSGASRERGVRECAGGDGYVGLVADDVDHIRGELVKLRATIDGLVRSALRGLVLVAVVVSERARREAVLGAKATGR